MKPSSTHSAGGATEIPIYRNKTKGLIMGYGILSPQFKINLPVPQAFCQQP